MRAFLDEPLPITVGTTRLDGTVQMNPVWYEFRDDQIWLNSGPGRDWARHLQRDARATLLLIDPNNMYRWTQILGRLASTSGHGADDHIEHLARRYTGRAYQAPKQGRVIIRLDPERVTGGERGEPWDVTP